MQKRVKLFVLVFALFVDVQRSSQCRPPPGWKPKTVEQLIQFASVVVRGYLIKKEGDINSYRACLYVTNVYKGFFQSNYVCANRFGSSSLCRTNLSYGIEYLIFLTGNPMTGYAAFYHSTFNPAAVRFTSHVTTELQNEICCPTVLGPCHWGKLSCLSMGSRPKHCFCQATSSQGFKG